MSRYGRSVPGLPGYSVTAIGTVFSHVRTARPRKLSPQPHHHGHMRVQLRVDGRPRSFFVHVLVALAWIGPPPFEGALVLHRDGNAANNRSTNLRYGTQHENMVDARTHGTLPIGERVGGSKLTRALVEEAHARKAAGTPTRALARDLGVAASTMARALAGDTWAHARPSPISDPGM